MQELPFGVPMRRRKRLIPTLIKNMSALLIFASCISEIIRLAQEDGVCIGRVYQISITLKTGDMLVLQ